MISLNNLYISFILYSLLFCSAYSQTEPGTSYFPLAIGNQWIYQTEDATEFDTTTIIDTQTVNGKLYFAIGPGSNSWNIWFRQENEKIYIVDTAVSRLDPSITEEYMLYDFSVIDKSWDVPLSCNIIRCNYGGYYKLVTISDTSITTAGVFIKCARFSSGSKCRDSGVFHRLFAPGIGIVSYMVDSYFGATQYYLTYSNLVTDVPDNNNSQSTFGYTLFQNYPNPFNPTTSITYSIPNEGKVLIKIYDVLGNEIISLVNKFELPGRHTINFDASGLTSGVYFYQLKTNYSVLTKKMILLR